MNLSNREWDKMQNADAFHQFARNARWGTCVDCPRDAYRYTYPEFCVNNDRYDHHLDIDSLAHFWKAHYTHYKEKEDEK